MKRCWRQAGIPARVKFTFSFPTSPPQGHPTQLFTQRSDVGNSELSEPFHIQTQVNDTAKEILNPIRQN